MLQLLRHFGVFETVMQIYGFLYCSPALVTAFLANQTAKGERERMGIPNTSTLIVLELVHNPQRKRVYTEMLLFELVPHPPLPLVPATRSLGPGPRASAERVGPVRGRQASRSYVHSTGPMGHKERISCPEPANRRFTANGDATPSPQL